MLSSTILIQYPLQHPNKVHVNINLQPTHHKIFENLADKLLVITKKYTMVFSSALPKQIKCTSVFLGALLRLRPLISGIY
jgi:hypothetical protein